MAYQYETLDVVVDGRLAIVTINNPPVNVITMPLYMDLMAITQELENDPDLSVVLFKSADPDFFIAHFDVELILSFPIDEPAEPEAELNDFHQLCERLRTMDKVTIAQIEGRIGGGGSEIASSMDMRFGVNGTTIASQMEVPLGILPGGSGTQRLPAIVGRARAMEIILGAQDLDAETAESWGYLNRALPAEEIDAWVGNLARRISRYPVAAVRLAKQSINAAQADPAEGLREEAYLFQQLLRTDDAQSKMKEFMNIGGQTREGELKVDELVDQLTFD
ncbi:MAG: enoyl-CoA hydratase/isomerase family protein [Halioglobus sp.]